MLPTTPSVFCLACLTHGGLGPKTHDYFFVNHVFYVPTIFLFYRLKQSLSTEASRQA